jgi:hypothetical protein
VVFAVREGLVVRAAGELANGLRAGLGRRNGARYAIGSVGGRSGRFRQVKGLLGLEGDSDLERLAGFRCGERAGESTISVSVNWQGVFGLNEPDCQSSKAEILDGDHVEELEQTIVTLQSTVKGVVHLNVLWFDGLLNAFRYHIASHMVTFLPRDIIVCRYHAKVQTLALEARALHTLGPVCDTLIKKPFQGRIK